MGIESLYEKSIIKLVSRLDKMTEDINSAVKENAAATNSITSSIDSLTEAVRNLTEVVTIAYKDKIEK